MLTQDVRLEKVKVKPNVQEIIYQESLQALLKAKKRLETMAKKGEIDLSTTELNQSLCNNLAELAARIDRQITAANLWQKSNCCPRCELKLMPLAERCVCGRINHIDDRFISDRLDFIVAENCTE